MLDRDDMLYYNVDEECAEASTTAHAQKQDPTQDLDLKPSMVSEKQ